MLCLSAVSATSDMKIGEVETDDGNLAVENKEVSNVLESSSDDALSAGNNWYVKAGSTGGDGSQDNPFGDLKSALDNTNLNEGDTIYILKGTYKGTSNTGLTIAKSNLKIVANDDNVIFDGENSRQIFKITGDNVLVKGLMLTKGKTTNGGALNIDGDNICIDDCTLTSNNANAGRGGAIYIGNHANISIINSNINSNKATYMGGGIYNLAPNTLIANCSFYNSISRNGGGIYSTNKIRIINATMASCKNDLVNMYGGGINLKGSDASYSIIDNVTFSSCYSDQGGAIALLDCSDITVQNCDISTSISITSTGQAANGDGAAIWMSSPNTLFKNTKIHDNSAYGWGVVFITADAKNSEFDNCTFLRNVATDYHGGAIYTRAEGLKISNSYFEKNHCCLNGGAIAFVSGKNTILENTTFVANYAAKGGAVHYYKSALNPKVVNCTFIRNGVFPAVLGDNVTKGGAIYSNANNTNVADSSFEENVGLSSGAIQLMGNNNLIEGCTFKSNIANHYGGGAISSGSISDTVSNCKFINNNAVGYGGAISMNYVTVVDSVFNENSADHGGAIYTICATVENCEFNENQANHNWVVLAENELKLSGNKNLAELVIIEDGLLLAPSATPQIPVQFGNNELIRITTSADGRVAYAEGYVAYCVENFTDAPTFGVLRSDVSAVTNSLTEEQVGEYLKLLVYHYGDKFEYADFANLVHIFTEMDYTASDNEVIKDILTRFNNGESLPDVYVEQQEDGSFLQYEFKSVIVPQATQNLLLYNISSVAPNMTVQKITINETVKVGDLVSFDIIVNNTGNCSLTGVYVIDDDYADGLEYDHFVDETGKWSYEGKGKWSYKGVLGIGESAGFTIVFKALSDGLKVNNVTAGNNITNTTVNSTNTTNVTVEHKNETEVPENETDVPENDTVVDKKPTKPEIAQVVKANEKATGNPILALLAALSIICVSGRRKFK